MGGANENPFVRGPRGLRPRRDGRAPREVEASPPVDFAVDLAVGLDPSILPPAIGIRAEPELVPGPAAEVDAPKRRGRPRKTPLPEAGVPAES